MSSEKNSFLLLENKIEFWEIEDENDTMGQEEMTTGSDNLKNFNQELETNAINTTWRQKSDKMQSEP